MQKTQDSRKTKIKEEYNSQTVNGNKQCCHMLDQQKLKLK